MSEKNKLNADSALWYDPLSRYPFEFHVHLRQLAVWLHAAQSLPVWPRQHGTENHHFDDADAGGGECRHRISTDRTNQIADQGSGGVNSSLGEALIIRPPRSRPSADG